MVASQEFIDKTIDAFRRAAEANRQTPARQGNLVALGPDSADEVMITGDLHGNRRNFNLIKQTADLKSHARRHLVLQEVCHGGPCYPENSGCMSHRLLEDVARLKLEYPERVHFILGNHELAEMTDYPIQKNHQMLNLSFRLGLQHMYGEATERVREAFIAFLQTCPLAVRLPHGVFVSHSVPQFCDERGFDKTVFTREIPPGEFFQRGPIFQLVWGRDYREENARAFAECVGAQVLINGHEPCPDTGFATPNRFQVILDCCGDAAGYVILSTRRPWTQEEVVAQVRRLG